MLARTRDEIQKESRKLTKEDLERVEDFKALVKMPGWNAYQSLLNNQIQSLMMGVLEPTENAAASEHKKGTVYGLIKARDLLTVIIAAAEEARKSEKKDDEEAPNTEKSDA